MSKPWSQSLVRTSFSEWLVDDAIREADGDISSEVEAVLRSVVEEKSQVAELKKALTSVKSKIDAATYGELTEELAEIREDFSWAKSKRGKYVAEIQDWVQTFHADLRARKEFDDLFVGGHASLEVVYISGKAKSDQVLHDLIDFLNEQQPPRKLLTKVTIGDKFSD